MSQELYAAGSLVRVKESDYSFDTWAGVEGIVVENPNPDDPWGRHRVKITKDPRGIREGAVFNLLNVELVSGELYMLEEDEEKEPETPELVEHPAHYGGDTVYEVIKVIRAWGLGFVLGNVVKYVARAGKKPGNSKLQDLKKARDYLNKEIEELEANND